MVNRLIQGRYNIRYTCQMKKHTKSPITDKLLRQPGQSLDEEVQRILDDKILIYLLFPSMFFLLATFEWYRWYSEMPPSPWLLTTLAIASIILSLFKIIPLKKKLSAMRQGSEGEKAVAEMLNQFREAKMKVFHDVIGENFNLDHVLVSVRGVFLVETKTYSKPLKGKTEIEFNGKALSVNNKFIGNDIVIQVTAGSKWLSSLIEDLTAKKIVVQPVVVFPGWYVKMTNEYKSNIWMVNPKNLGSFINKKNEVLSEEDVKLISNHLTRYIRTK